MLSDAEKLDYSQNEHNPRLVFGGCKSAKIAVIFDKVFGLFQLKCTRVIFKIFLIF